MSGSSGRAPTQREIETLAGTLVTAGGLIEKDWYVVRALGALTPLRWNEDLTTRLVFGGGTSLSKGWGLISRFSEDIDFRLWHDDEEVSRPLRKTIRSDVVRAMTDAGFEEIVSAQRVRNDYRFVEMHFSYAVTTPVPVGLRKDIKVDITMTRPRMAPVGRQISSFVAKSRRGGKPELSSVLCMDPVEIAAEKLSAFAWRSLDRNRDDERDDPAVVRHLYDLAKLHERISASWAFAGLARHVIAADAGRGGDNRPTEQEALLDAMVKKISDDAIWSKEYRDYIHEVSYGTRDGMMAFETALSTLKLYAELLRQ